MENAEIQSSSNQDGPVDVIVIGGGINGAGIARDAAGRGLKVVLCEKNDLGSATSSASSKLIHGGLRYLEQYEFGLVRKALKEREVLMMSAPHLVRPLNIVLPHSPRDRPAWMIRIGLFLYDHIGGARSLPGSSVVDLRQHPAGKPLLDTLKRGFVYSDCWTDDARLVATNAIDAAEREAEILTRTEVVSAVRVGTLWNVELRDCRNGRTWTRETKILVNAGGPWAADVLTNRLGLKAAKRLRLVKGSHIVVPRLSQGDHAYLLQNHDGRVIFVMPFQDRFSLIGTTEVELDEMPDDPSISDDEVQYLCDAVGDYFRSPPTPDDVVWSYAGVRPLFNDDDNDPSAISRDYALELDAPPGKAPLLSVLGGKLTTFRVLAETAMDMLAPFSGKDEAWTAGAPLPGGNIPASDFYRFQADLRAQYPWMEGSLLRRLARSYGTLIYLILGDGKGPERLGYHYGEGVYEAEVDYLMKNEWVETIDDLLWRRSKLGLFVTRETKDALQQRLLRG